MAKRASLVDRSPAPTMPQSAAAASAPPKSRAGRVGISFWVNPNAHRQLRHLSVDTGQSVQALMEQAVDLLFREHGKPRFASPPGTRSRGLA